MSSWRQRARPTPRTPNGHPQAPPVVHRALTSDRGGGPAARPPLAHPTRSGLAQDPVHLRDAHGALALRHAAAVLLVDLALEVSFFSALHAVAVVGVGHGTLLACAPRKRPAAVSPRSATCGHATTAGMYP